MDFTELLIEMVKQQASDLFISVGAPPQIKVEGNTVSLSKVELDSEATRSLVYSMMTEEQMKTFERDLELNMAMHLPKVGRFRVNVFNQRGEPAVVFRYIKDKIPSISTLGLPTKLNEIISEQRGLVLVVGGTGTGKSTTLASMIDYRAKTKSGHILSIEDPIEFIHHHQKSLVNQREVGLDTLSYAAALKNAMREAPDVIMIGEIRDRDTMQHALSYAETGHLCVSTLHANNANQAIDRILNFFPETAHNQILMDLSLHLKVIVSQRLCVGLKKKRVPAIELMFNTPFVADLIRQAKIDQIKEVMTESKSMVHKTFDQALYDLFVTGKISDEEALRHADSKNNLSLQIRLNKDAVKTEPPIEKEISFNKKAPFERYTSFSLSPLKISKKRRADAEKIFTSAMKTALELKGLKYKPEDATIEVQYGFGIENVQGLTLQAIDNQSDTLSQLTEDTEQQAALLINIRDKRFNRCIWRLQAKQKIEADEPIKSQDEVTSIVSDLLSDYPPIV